VTDSKCLRRPAHCEAHAAYSARPHTTGSATLRRLEDDHKLQIHHARGTHYGYSGDGINLAQLVVEKVTGKSATALMQEELYTPLKMIRTSMV
jgi:CubicO group peptidase (beta-lactamase class C family)